MALRPIDPRPAERWWWWVVGEWRTEGSFALTVSESLLCTGLDTMHTIANHQLIAPLNFAT